MPDGSKMDHWDAAVVGGGPAGMAAALWLGRYRRKTLLFDSGDYRSRWVSESHGYLGSDGIDPAELRARAVKDLERYETVRRCEDLVTSVKRDDDGFVVRTSTAEERVRKLVIATGVRDTFPQIENFFDHYGRSVFVCPSCDGYEARDKRVVVFGWSPDVVAFADHLLEWAATTTIVTNGARFEGDESEVRARPDIEVREESASQLLGEPGEMTGVRLANGETVDAEMAFITIDQTPANELAVELGCRVNEAGCVVVDEEGMTSVDGVYAAGDLIPSGQLIQIAAATGATAGLSCARALA